MADANFAQPLIRSDRMFSEIGQKTYGGLTGTPIKTVDDLAAALSRGEISPSQVPLDFVDLDGTRLIRNTRASTALRDAGIPLSAAERDQVKWVAKALLARLNDVLVLNWRQKSAGRSTLKLAIEDTLDTLPEAYDRQLFAQKCSAVFEHVYESYPERDVSVYRFAGASHAV